MEIVIFLVIFSVIVAAVAGARGRSRFGWFLLSCLVSPLISILILLLLPNLKRAAEQQALLQGIAASRPNIPPPALPAQTFVPDGVLAGIPYQALSSGAIAAMMPGGLVQFRSREQFEAAVQGRTEGPR
jgi:hypothetical protein